MANSKRSLDIQERITATILGTVLPLSIVGMIVGAAAAFFAYDHQFRLAPALVLLGVVLFAFWVLFTRKIFLAAHIFTAGVCVAILMGMMLNGGVLAAGYKGFLILIPLAAWFYGPRMAVIASVLCVLTGGVFVLLDNSGVLHEAYPVTPWQVWIYTSVAAVLIMGLTAIPSSMLYKTLDQSERRQDAVKEAYEREKQVLESLKEHQQALQKLNTRYEALFDRAGDGILLLDMNLNILAVNNAFSRMHGYTAEEIKSMGIKGLDMEMGEPVPEQLNRLLAGEILKFEVIHRHKDGHLFPMAVTASLIDSDGEKVIIATHHDLTERRQREEYAVMLGRMLDEAPASITVHDTEGRFYYANQMTIDLHGYEDIDDFMQINLHELDVPESEALIAERIRTIEETGEMRFEAAHYRKDGSIMPLAIHARKIDWQGKPALLSIASDISERKRTQEALTAESEFNRLVIQNAGQGICVCHETPEFPYVHFTVWNDSMTQITGYTMEEINRLGWYQSVYPDPEIQARAVARMQAMREGDDIKAEEWEITRADGQKRHLLITTCLNKDGKGEKYVLGVMSDVTERKHAEEEIKRAHDFVGNVINAIADPVFVKDEEHRFVLVNDAEVALLGYAREELIGKTDKDFFPEEEVKVFWEGDQQVLTHGEDNINEESITDMRTGETRIIVTRKTRYVDPRGKRFIVGISSDITERKQSEDAVKRAFDFVGNVINAIADPVFVKDEQHRFVLVNDAALSLWGYRREELIGKTDTDFFPEEEVKVFWEMDHQVLVTGEENINEESITSATKHEIRELITRKTRYVDAAGKRYIVGISTDITERKRAEEALRVSEERFRIAAATVSDFIYERDMATGEAEFFGDLDGCLGYAPGGFPRSLQGWFERIYPEDVAQVMETLQQASQGDCHYTLEYRLQRSDGTYADWLESGVFLRDNDGKPIKCIGSASDITARKQAAVERERMEEQLRQAQKMEAVGMLAGGVAHEFNNLLQVILGLVEIVQMEIGAESASGLMLEDVNRAGRRAAELTQDLLAFSRRQTLTPTTIDLNSLINNDLNILRPLIGADIDLQFLPGNDLGIVRADRRQVEVVLMNLCSNARDAMPNGGMLTITTVNTELDAEFCAKHEGVAPGKYVCVSVADTGHGMDEAKCAQIFEPFFTTKGVGKGTGLGLATVYGIIIQHKGIIDVTSELGKGTVFRFYLPVVDEVVEEVRPKVQRLVPGGTETILVAEDDDMLLALLQKILTRSGYKIYLARNGEEAIKLFDSHADEIDLALLDVIMPVLGGQHVMAHIQSAAPHVKFLFSSGYSENAIQTDFIIKDGLRLIKKPYKSTDLLRAIRETLDA